MSIQGKIKNSKKLPLSHKLVLNQWIVSLFGFNPLKDHKDHQRTLRPIKPLAKTLKGTKEGLTPDNLHYFYHALNIDLQETAEVTQNDLLRYEQNIVSHTLSINEKRDQQVIWKYYQWLSLLFAEIYLDRFFTDPDILLDRVNKYVEIFNKHWMDAGYETGISEYTRGDLNKLCLQNATGSGKTLLMHANFLQFQKYMSKSQIKLDLTRSILITPNETLSNQHHQEMEKSGIMASRLLTDNSGLLSPETNLFRRVDYTEITKLGEVDGPTIIATRNLGDQNFLLVDEAHRGMGSSEERGWFKNRERLSEKGFVFEYSATLKEAIAAANRQEIEESYAKSILFDYSYKYFYEDGYGKDYRIFNLPRTYSEIEFSYLTSCLMSFYQQLKLFHVKKDAFLPYNIEKPLWVFVGSSVTKSTGTKSEKETVSDVGKIIGFLSKFLENEAASASEIERILNGNAKETGLIDENGNDIFSGEFVYLSEIFHEGNWNSKDIFRDILEIVFQNGSGGELSVSRIKGSENEIALRVGQSKEPFGLINVGDASGLSSYISEQNIDNVTVLKSEFSEEMFGKITHSTSPINLLIGSKRFVEGWDCWRVSTLGLMHVGKSEGAQIIQLFGRGVRLKGYKWSLQRSSVASPTYQPEFIQYIETLNVFGIKAEFMERFRQFLEEEKLPENYRKQVFKVPLNITYDFGLRLKVLRPRKKRGDGREFDFKHDAAVPSIDRIPEKFRKQIIIIDWYPRIQSIESKSIARAIHKEASVFTNDHLVFLNFDDLYFRLEKFKGERGWHNINISKQNIKYLFESPDWYSILSPSSKMELSDFSNVFLWQEMASEILQKYLMKYYNYCKAEFIEPRLELREIEPGDGMFPDDEYKLIIDSSETSLIHGIKKLIYEINRSIDGILRVGDLRACMFGIHLYRPTLHAAKESKIKIAPVSLNESEFRFLNDLVLYVEEHEEDFKLSNTSIFLLRNESRGRGVGFFEAGNFYPDFFLWLVCNGMQHLAFIEPHGLRHEGIGSKKVEFHKIVKDIERRLSSDNVILDSFIVTPTPFSNLNWGKTKNELEDMNVLFMDEGSTRYIEKIIMKMKS